MTLKTVTVSFAVNSEDVPMPMAVVRDALSHELLSVWKDKEASDLYHTLTRGDMRIDYNDELRAIRPSEESST